MASETLSHDTRSVTPTEEEGTESFQDHPDVCIPPVIAVEDFGSGKSDCNYQPRVWKDMGKLFQQETLSDIMLMAEGQTIPCHKFLLAAASEYFYSKLVAASDPINNSLLEIEGVSFQSLKVIVSYIYSGNINITVDNAVEVIPACKVLKLNSAYDTCVACLLDSVDPMNCIGLYNIATEHDMEHLKERSSEVMVNNFKEVVSGPEYHNMSVDDVDKYIQNDGLRIPNEDSVYHALISWIRFQPDERSHHFTELVKRVRFCFCSRYCMEHIVSKEPLMDTLEYQKTILSAMKHQGDHHYDVCVDKEHDENLGWDLRPRKGYESKQSMIIIGDISDLGGTTSGECWRLENYGWEVLKESPMPPEIVGLFSACMARYGIVVSGGSSQGKPASQCWLLSTSTYQWRPLPDLNTARLRHASVCVGGQVYVIGGEGTRQERLSSVETLQRNGRQWSTLPQLPQAVEHPMAAAYGQCVYVFGGINASGQHSRTVYVYRTSTESWKKLADMSGICGFGAAVVWKDMIYLVGGFRRSCMSFDPVINAWTTLCQCRYEHADGPALVWKDRILVCGGRSTETKCDDSKAGGTSMIEEYNPVKDTWAISQMELPQKLRSHFMFVTE